MQRDDAVELAKSYRLPFKDLRKVRELIEAHEEEIRDAWKRHLGH